MPLLISKAAAANLILVDALTIAVADGGIELSTSEHAAVVQDTAPSAPANVVSGFQTNTSFLRIVRYLHWVKGYADSVGFLTLPIAGSPA